MNDAVNHPKHYAHESGVEAIDIAEHLGFNLGNAFKYAWRAGQKDDTAQDIRKAMWYVRRAEMNEESHAVPLCVPRYMHRVLDSEVCGQRREALRTIVEAAPGGLYLWRAALGALQSLLTHTESLAA